MLGAVTATPAIRVVREGDDRRSYSLSSASAERDPAHRWTGAFSAPRMRTLRGHCGALKSLHRVVSTSDVPVVTRRHTRVGIRCRPMCFPSARRCPRETLERQARSGFDLRVIGPSCGLPVRARRAEPGNAFFRIDSLRAMNPQTAPRSLWIEIPCARTVSPSVHPRPASDGATDFFPASALAAPRGLATS
jgi:hypothetical protein